MLLLGAVGTSAYWTDEAVVDSGTISSGSLDLELQTPGSGTAWLHQGNGTSTTDTALALDDLTPGETQAFDLAARNVADVAFTYAVSVDRVEPWGLVDGGAGSPVTVRFYAGPTARASNDTTHPRTGSCSGTAQSAGAVRVGTSSSTVVPDRTLDVGSSEQLCAVVGLADDAVTANQGQQGAVQLTFTATQVAP